MMIIKSGNIYKNFINCGCLQQLSDEKCKGDIVIGMEEVFIFIYFVFCGYMIGLGSD